MTLQLYHADHSVCAQKVRPALAEKQLEWQGHLLDLLAGEIHTPTYRQINPNEVVPPLLHGGAIAWMNEKGAEAVSKNTWAAAGRVTAVHPLDVKQFGGSNHGYAGEPSRKTDVGGAAQ